MSDAVLKPQLIIRQFDNLTSYADRFVEMKTLTEQRDADTPDELWILQHHDVLTQGQAGKPEHILMSSNIPAMIFTRIPAKRMKALRGNETPS